MLFHLMVPLGSEEFVQCLGGFNGTGILRVRRRMEQEQRDNYARTIFNCPQH